MEADRLEVFRKLLLERLSVLQGSFGSRLGELVDQRDALADT